MSLNEKRQEWNVFPSCLFESIKLFKSFLMKRKFYKNNVGCIIFIVLVYPEIVMESCLTYEKKVNDCRKFYELRIFYSFFFRVCYNAVRIIDRNCNCIYSGGN